MRRNSYNRFSIPYSDEDVVEIGEIEVLPVTNIWYDKHNNKRTTTRLVSTIPDWTTSEIHFMTNYANLLRGTPFGNVSGIERRPQDSVTDFVLYFPDDTYCHVDIKHTVIRTHNYWTSPEQNNLIKSGRTSTRDLYPAQRRYNSTFYTWKKGFVVIYDTYIDRIKLVY